MALESVDGYQFSICHLETKELLVFWQGHKTCQWCGHQLFNYLLLPVRSELGPVQTCWQDWEDESIPGDFPAAFLTHGCPTADVGVRVAAGWQRWMDDPSPNFKISSSSKDSEDGAVWCDSNWLMQTKAIEMPGADAPAAGGSWWCCWRVGRYLARVAGRRDALHPLSRLQPRAPACVCCPVGGAEGASVGRVPAALAPLSFTGVERGCVQLGGDLADLSCYWKQSSGGCKSMAVCLEGIWLWVSKKLAVLSGI